MALDFVLRAGCIKIGVGKLAFEHNPATFRRQINGQWLELDHAELRLKNSYIFVADCT